jgi:Fe-S-cluster containining protein
MTGLSQSDAAAFAAAVRKAARREEVPALVATIYADLELQIARRKPVCVVSGRCCRFDEYGHRLFVTTIELAAFVSHLEKENRSIPVSDGRGCPFQINRLCSVHAIRPFGCRVFFCDSTSFDWQTEQYERFHRELKTLHQELDVPYFYVEWREALAAIGLEHQASTLTEF